MDEQEAVAEPALAWTDGCEACDLVLRMAGAEPGPRYRLLLPFASR